MNAPHRPRIEVAAAVLERGGRILITRRPAGTHLGGLWEFPGGKRNPGESWEACLVREIREELGIDVGVGRLVHATEHEYPEKTVALKFFHCRLLRGEPRALGVADYCWTTPEDLYRYTFPPADEPLLELVRTGEAFG